MVVVECFVAKRSTGRSLTMSIDELRRSLDRNAPAPWYGCCPNGIPLYVFVVDFHKAPASVCGRFGFEHCRVDYFDIRSELYTSLNELTFPMNRWIRLFLTVWSRESSSTSLNITNHQQHTHP